MKRTIPLFLLLCSGLLQAQPALKFDKRFAECEDRWVVFPMGKDSSYPFGFIYMDAQAGLTLNYEGSYRVNEQGAYNVTRPEKAMMKYRLQPNDVRVAFLPEALFSELKVEARPDWLKFYKEDTSSVQHFYRWGFLYNGLGECAMGLSYLEKAQQMDPHFKGLAVELAYSYNCLKQYERSIPVLEIALADNPGDAYAHKELLYALVKLNQTEKAVIQYRKAVESCKDTTYHAENAYNLLANFYNNKDRKNFQSFLEEARKWTAGNKAFSENIKIMEGELKE